MNRRRYIKTAVVPDEYVGICQRADLEGLSLSAYLRVAVARDNERQSLTQVLETIHAALPMSSGQAVFADIEPVLIELLHLVRLLSASNNPQAAARIISNVNQQFPNRRIK